MAAPQSSLFQLQYRESGNVRSMQHTQPSQLQTGSEKPLSTLWLHVTILSLMSEGKNILYSQKYPKSGRTLFKVTGHIQGFIFRTICSYEHLRHVLYLIHCPTIHCSSLSAPFFDHSSTASVECVHVKEACMKPRRSLDRNCTCPFWQPTDSQWAQEITMSQIAILPKGRQQ